MSKVLTVAAFGVFGTLALLFANSSPTVQAATSTYFNFQARLLTDTGAVVADGNYNIEFKIYDDIDSGEGSLLWTETRKVDGGPDNRVRVVNGYFSVKLGEVTALPSINWNQELFLTMNIGGTTTGTPSWDGEMLNSSKRIQLTAVPYAFTAKELQMTSGSFTNTLLFATPSGSSKTITIPNETGTVCTTAAAGVCSLAGGYVQLQSTTPGTAQTGNLNITGTGIIGTVKSNTFDGSAGTVNFNSGIYSFNDQFQVNNGLTNANSVHISTTLTGNNIAGINLQPTFNTNGAGQTQYGQRITVTNSAASANTLYGQYISFTDAGSLANSTIGLYVDASTANANDTQYSAILQGGNVGIGTATPTALLNISGAGGGSNLLTITDTTATARDVMTIADGGATTFSNQTNSATAFQIQNAASGSLLQVDTTTGGAITLLGNNSGELTSWTSDTDTLPAARGGAATASYNGYVYAIAGSITGGTAQDDIYYARLNANGGVSIWTTESDLLPADRRNMAAVAANGYLYAFGGQSGGVNTATSNVYYTKLNGDGSTGAWSELTANALPSARSETGAFIYNNYVYIIGGSSGSSDQATATTYDTSYYAYLNADGTLGTWNTTTVLPAARGAVQPVTANGYVYVIGGTDTDSNTVNTSYYAKLNVDGTIGAWTADPDTLPTSRGFGGIVINNGYIYYMGGWISGGSSTQSTTYYSPLGSDGSIGAWTTNTAAFAEARDTITGFTANGYLYAIGGIASGTRKDTVYYASGSRVTIGGGLDLVGLSGENLSEGGSGGTLTAGNTKIIGSLEVQGQTSFSQNVDIGGSLRVGGPVAVQNGSKTGFIVQGNSNNNTIVDINTLSYVNLLNEGNFEGTQTVEPIGGWSEYNGAETTFATSTDAGKFVYGSRSLKVITSAAASNQGAKYVFPFKPNTTYSFSAYVSLSASGGTAYAFLANVNGSDETCDSGNGGTGLTFTTTPTRYTCIFTTGATVLNGTDFLFVRRASTDANVRTIYIDGAQLEQTSYYTSYTEPVALNLVNNPSFEASANGWALKGSGTTIAQDEQYYYSGVRSLKVTTTTTANAGAAYTVPLSANTLYTLSGFARVASGSITDFVVGRQDNGSDNTCLTAQTVTTAWTRFSCSFTTATTVNSTTNIFFQKSGASGETFYIDAVQLERSYSPSQYVEAFNNLHVDTATSTVTINGSNLGELGPWQLNGNALPAARYGPSSVVANGYIYSIGGSDASTEDEVYYAKLNADGSTGAWSTNANSLPAPRTNFGAVVANGYVYAVGGWGGSANVSTVFYAKLNADGSTGAWSTNANSLPAVRGYLTSVVANGYIYAIGGTSPSTEEEVFYAKLNADGSTGIWSTNANSLPSPRDGHASVVANGYVYVIGGSNGGAVSTVYYAKLNADGSTGAWSTNANALPVAKFYIGPAVANGYVYAIAGNTGPGGTSSIFYAKLNADGSTGAWSTNANALPVTRSEHTTAIANGYVYVIGGCCSHSTVYYASTSRILIGGSLDLVGLGGQNLADGGDFSQGSTGGSLTAGNTQIIGSLQVQGQANFSQGVAILGNLTLGGDLTPNAAPTINTTAQSINSVVTTGDVGNWNDMAMPPDGRAVILHIEFNSASDHDIQLAKCDNTACTSATNTEAVNATEAIDEDSAIAIGSDGLPIIVYQPETSADLIAVHCGNATCSSGNTTTTLDNSVADTGENPSITIGIDGFPIISYIDATNNDLDVYHCANVACTSGSRTDAVDANTVASTGPTAIAIGKDGLPVIAFRTTSDALRVTKCQTISCSSVSIATTVEDSANAVAENISMIIGSNGTPFIVHFDETNDDYRVYYCGNAECSSDAANLATTIETGGISSNGFSGLALGVDGFPVIAMYFNGALDIEVLHCESRECDNWNKTTVETGNDVGKWPALVIGQDTLPIIAYADETGNDVRVAKCADLGCFETASAKYSGGISLGSANSYFRDIYAVNYFGKQFSLSGFDVAEEYAVEDTTLKPAEAVALNPSSGRLRRATASDRNMLFGIVSTQPGVALRDYNTNRTDTRLIALVGKVPLKVKGQVNVGDPLTISDTPGVAAKAISAGMILGRALEAQAGGEGTITVYAQTTYYVPTVNLQGSDFVLIQDLYINGRARVAYLEVSGNATFKGNIIVAGHFVSAGESPQTEVLAANTSTNDPQIDIEGNDTSGLIKVITTQSVQPGDLVKIIFARPFDKQPKVFLYPSNLEATTIQVYREVQVNYFIIKLISPLANDKTYEFNYLIVE